MPIKPGKDESQSDWMSRCVPEMIGTGEDKRPQDQAVAACLSILRDKDKGASKSVEQIITRAKTVCEIFAKQPDVPEPDDDEGRDEFIDRCVDELTDADENLSDDDAESACA